MFRFIKISLAEEILFLFEEPLIVRMPKCATAFEIIFPSL
jgi:hypothetical protein